MAQINPQTASPNHSELEPQSKAESIGKSEDYGMHDESVTSKAATALKLDQNGFPLRPQPSDDPKGMPAFHVGSSNRGMLLTL